MSLGKGIEALIPDIKDWYIEKIVCPDCGGVQEGVKLSRPITTTKTCKDCEVKQLTAQFRGKVTREIPPKYKKCKPEDAPKLESSILWGSYGVGKTHSLWCMIKKYGKNDYIKTSEYRLSMDLKAGYSDNTHDNRVEKYKNIGFLAIDEYGKVKDTENHRAMIFDILDYRYEQELLTVIAVNAKSIEDLNNIITLDIMDRYRKNIIQLSGESKRNKF